MQMDPDNYQDNLFDTRECSEKNRARGQKKIRQLLRNKNSISKLKDF